MQIFRPSVPQMKYHANDWNIVSKQEKEIERITGLQFLSSNFFKGRCVEWKITNYFDLKNNLCDFEGLIKKRWFFVVVTGEKVDRKIVLINNTNDLLLEIQDVVKPVNPKQVILTFINMIQKCEGCCSGVVLSDGKGKLKIELMNDTVNTRDITDGTKKNDSMIYLETSQISLKTIHGAQNPYTNTMFFRYVVEEVVRCCYKQAGYFEFIFGSNQNVMFPNLIFTYYSQNTRYGFEHEIWE